MIAEWSAHAPTGHVVPAAAGSLRNAGLKAQRYLRCTTTSCLCAAVITVLLDNHLAGKPFLLLARPCTSPLISYARSRGNMSFIF
jgi:hypothetical protein